MSKLTGLGGGGQAFDAFQNGRTEHVMLQRPLQRVLQFRGRSIDDVVNSPIVKNEIRLYWKHHKQIIRRGEIVELERQWNSVAL
jgi:hypothetical protein